MSDDSDFDTPLTRSNGSSPRLLAAKSMAGSDVRQVEKVPNGLPGNKHPTGNEGSSTTHCPIPERRVIESDKGKLIALEAGPMSKEIAISGEGAGWNVKSTANSGEKKESEMNKLARCTESSSEKAKKVMEYGQKEANTQNHNGSQEPLFKNSRDLHMEPTGPNSKWGLTIHTYRAVSHCECEKHQEQITEIWSALKVYSRARGCRKKAAQPSRRENLPVKTKFMHSQKQPRQELQTANRGNEGYTASSDLDSDSDSMDLNSQPEQRKTLQSRNQCSNNFLEEATTQWEMEKDLGMTWGSKQPEIIEKIASMEIRDRKEVKLLGKRIKSS